MTTAVIIPARYASTRFPGKPLTKIGGKPMIEWVIINACKSKLADRVIVATEDKRIFDFVKLLAHKKVEVYLTIPEHKCGTDRICEVVRRMPDIKYVVNLQGDEPLMPPEYIDKVLEPLVSPGSQDIQTPETFIVSLVAQVTSQDEVNNPNLVKVVMDKKGFALYFSRSLIPYNRSQESGVRSQDEVFKSQSIEAQLKDLDAHILRDIQKGPSKPQHLSTSTPQHLNTYFRHIGIYAFTRELILQFSQLPQSSLEITEQLEQLRALENGIKIKLEVVSKAYPAVDTQEDITKIEKLVTVNIK